MGLKRAPTICTTSARLSPMVWWLGGRVRIVIPAALPDEMNAKKLRWMLAHELAHVRRRDHLVRWLEWLACVCFWWNPVAWWARRNLRINEEICCDALVLSSLHPKPRTYANSLLTVIEFLASPAIRPPVVASEINSGGILERRLRMIVSKNPIPKTPRWLVAGVLLTALGLMPLGVAYAQDRDGERSKEDCEALARTLKAAVANGELTAEEAREQYEAACGKGDKGERGSKRITREDFARAAMEIRQAVAEGELTEEEGRAKLAGMRRAMAGQGEGADAIWRRVAGALIEAGIERDKIRAVMGLMKRIVPEVQSEGDAFELDPGVYERLAGIGLTDEQIELVVGLSQRIASLPADAGRGRGRDDIRGRIIRALMENGIAREQVRGVMATLRPIIGEIQREGEAFELDPGVRERLEGMGLTGEQIDFVVRLAQRLASHRG